MDPAGIQMTRALPIDGALLGDVLLRLRRDSPASALRWTLGGLGTAEVDARFTSAGPGWTTEARLWNAAGRAVVAVTVRLAASDADEVLLTLESNLAPAPAWGDAGGELSALARAAVDELAEELLWHATRAGLSRGG